MESKFPELLDARGDQGALEIKSPRNRGLLHSDVDYNDSIRMVSPICTHHHVCCKMALLHETIITFHTLICSFTSVCPIMLKDNKTSLRERLLTLTVSMVFIVMYPHVCWEVFL